MPAMGALKYDQRVSSVGEYEHRIKSLLKWNAPVLRRTNERHYEKENEVAVAGQCNLCMQKCRKPCVY